MTDRAAIIHGTMSSPEGNWFPWLKSQLADRGIETVVPQMPSPNGQSLDGWIEAFAKQVCPIDELDQHWSLIGHSLGATFVLRLLERINVAVSTVVLVSGFTGRIGLAEYDQLNASFIDKPFDWDAIKAHAGKFHVVYGTGDPYVPEAALTELPKQLGVAAKIIADGKHLNAENGFTSLPLITELLTATK